jgi:hypothetical protein
MYILSNTRKNNSARTSQCGIRCGAWCGGGCGAGRISDTEPDAEVGTEPDANPGAEAGFGKSEGVVSSGCWDILKVRTSSLVSSHLQAFDTDPLTGPAQGRRTATVTQQGAANRATHLLQPVENLSAASRLLESSLS